MKRRCSEADVALYIEGDLPPVKADEIEAHLLSCSACRSLAAELREGQSVLRSLRQDMVGAAALASVRTRVLSEIGARGVRPVWSRWIYAVAGAMFVAAVVVGLMAYYGKPQAQFVQIVRHEVPVTGLEAAPSTELAPPVAPRSREATKRPARVRKALPQNSTETSQTSLAQQENIEAVEKDAEPPKQLVVKLLTDDPNIVIYWLIDQTGGGL